MSLINQPPQFMLQTDASLTGSGVVIQGKCISGTWLSQEIWHIKELELLSIKFAFQTFLKDQKLTLVHIQMKNMVALAHIRDKESKNDENSAIAIWEISLSNGVMITGKYLSSALNKLAYQEPRRMTKNSKRILCEDILSWDDTLVEDTLCEDTLEVNLFAS